MESLIYLVIILVSVWGIGQVIDRARANKRLDQAHKEFLEHKAEVRCKIERQ